MDAFDFKHIISLVQQGLLFTHSGGFFKHSETLKSPGCQESEPAQGREVQEA